MRGSLGPPSCLAGGFDSVANVFAIAERSFTQQSSIKAAHLHAVAGIGTRLLTADVEFHRAVDCRRRNA